MVSCFFHEFSFSSGFNILARFNRTSISSDNVFGDNSAAQMEQQTLTMSGNTTDGYTATVLVGVAR